MKSGKNVYLGLDLGASSGRAVLGFLRDNRLEIKQVSRFSNGYFELGGTLYWDFIGLWSNVVESMRQCSRMGYDKLAGIAVDTWGIDYGLIGADGKLIGQPICYRDSSTEGMVERILSKIGPDEIYRITGLAAGRVATLPQLVAVKNSPGSDRLKMAKHLLMMPGLFRYFLCGDCSIELSAAGSSLMLNVRRRQWSSKILRTFAIPSRIFSKVIEPGTVVGKLKKDIAEKTGLNQAPVVAIAGHDTLSAAAAAPFADEECIFIICGTWSVLGQIIDKPITTKQACRFGFVNEPGVQSIIFARNMMGLYVFENLHRVFKSHGKKISYAGMVQAASRARAFKCTLDMNSSLFFVTQNPAQDVSKFLRKTGQNVSLTPGELIRSILEGLAFSYRQALEQLSKVTGRKISRICLLGGGIRNRLLCQMAADATGLEVIAGPAEATIAGNFGVQALATGQLKTSADIRRLVRDSFKLKTYKPKSTKVWLKHYPHYKRILERSKKIK